ISSSFNTAVTIYILIPFLIIPQLLFSGVMVKFDKLNPIVAEQGGVPWIGEAMTSRWAFEALAVNQYINNDYEKQFYRYDKIIAIADYKTTFWAQKLEAKIIKVENDLVEGKNKEDMEKGLKLIHDEMVKENSHHPKVVFKDVEKLVPGKVSPELLESLRTYINEAPGNRYTLRQYYIDRNKKAREKKDSISTLLNATPELRNKFVELQESYENVALNNMVRNSGDMGDKCLEKDGKLIQRTDPIFLDPDNNNGRAHFYAPTKKLFGNQFPTFWYNLTVIWLMSIFMMVTLYFDVLKKILDFFGNIPNMLSRKR
ncbi:MAG: ATP-binding cassette domain-containing protein, partial [Bacteroidia bacterium]